MKKNKQIFHPYWDWECFHAGFFETSPPSNMTKDEAKYAYYLFLRDLPRFEAALQRVLLEWPISCEQFLSNSSINRIAWLGQASMCIETGVPSYFKSGFQFLSATEKNAANNMAKKYLDLWLNKQK